MTAVPLPKPDLRIVRADSPPPPAEDRPENFYPLVRRIADGFARNRRTTGEDMVQVGMVAVLRHWFAFDPALSSRATWAGNVARHAMLDAMREGGGHAVIRLPRLAAARGEAYPTFHRLRPGRGGKEYGDGYDDPTDHRAPPPAPPDPGEFLAAAAALAGRSLTRRERGSLLLYYVRGMDMKEAGSHMGVGQSRVSMILSEFYAACRENAGVTA